MKADAVLAPNVLRMAFKRIAIVALVLLCSPIARAADATDEKIILRIATGSKTGVYYPMGYGIKRVIEDTYPDHIST